jgi:hypothetical protein
MIDITRNEPYLEPIKLNEFVINPIFYKTSALNALTGIFNNKILEYLIYGYLGLDKENRIVPSPFAKKLFEDAIKTLIEINFENAKKQFPFLENFTLEEVFKALFIDEIRIVDIPNILETENGEFLVIPNTLLFADKIVQVIKNKALIQSLPYGYITYKRLLQQAVELYFYNDVVKSYNYELETIMNDMSGKSNYFKDNIVSKTVDYSGRSVVVPDITLKLGEAKIPDISYYWTFDEIYVKALLEEYKELLYENKEIISNFFKENAHLLRNAYYEFYKKKTKISEDVLAKLKEEIIEIDKKVETLRKELFEKLKEQFEDKANDIMNLLLVSSGFVYRGILSKIKNKDVIDKIITSIKELEREKSEKEKKVEGFSLEMMKEKELSYKDIVNNAIYKHLLEKFDKFLKSNKIEISPFLKEFIIFERVFYETEKKEIITPILEDFESAFGNRKIIEDVLIKYKDILGKDYDIYLNRLLSAKTKEEFDKIVQELEPEKEPYKIIQELKPEEEPKLEPKLSYKDYKTLIEGKKIIYKGKEKVILRKESEIKSELAKKFVKLVRYKLPAYALFVRQPTLWRHNLQTFKVYPEKDKVIKIFPLQTEGFDGDFDGDTYGYFALHFEKSIENLTIENNLLDSFGNLVYRFKNEFLSAFANPRVKELIEIISLKLNDNEILRKYDEIIKEQRAVVEKQIEKDKIISLLQKYRDKIGNNFEVYLNYLIEIKTGEIFKQVLEDLSKIMTNEDYNLLLKLLEGKDIVKYYIINDYEKFNEIFKYIVFNHKDKALDILTFFLREIVKYAHFTFDISEIETLSKLASLMKERDYFGDLSHKNEILRIIENDNEIKSLVNEIISEEKELEKISDIFELLSNDLFIKKLNTKPKHPKYKELLAIIKFLKSDKDIPNQVELLHQIEEIEKDKESFEKSARNLDLVNVNAMNSKTSYDIWWQIVSNRGVFSNMKGDLQFPIRSSLLYRTYEDENGNIVRETKGLSSIEFFISAHNQRYALGGGKANIGRGTNLGSFISYALRTLTVIDNNCNLDTLYCPYIKEDKICRAHLPSNVNPDKIGVNIAHYYRRKLVNSLFKFKHKAGVLKSAYARIITKKQYVDEIKKYLISFYKPYEIKFYNENLGNELVLVAKVIIKSKKGTIENWLSALENYILLQHNYPLKLVYFEKDKANKTIKQLMDEYDVVVGKRVDETTYAIIPDEIIKTGEEFTIDGWTDYALLYRYVNKNELKERHYNEIKELTSAFFSVDKTSDLCLKIISNLVIEKKGLKNAFIKGNINDDWFLLAFGEKYLPVIALETIKGNKLNEEKVYRF